MEHSNFTRAKRLAYDIYDQPVQISTRQYKKLMIKNPFTNKFVHFGDIRYKDYLNTMDRTKRMKFLNRTSNMRGNWKDNDYSANNLARRILWDEFDILEH
jgi:hypothetical protein